MEYSVILFLSLFFISGGAFGIIGIAIIISNLFEADYNVNIITWLKTTKLTSQAKEQFKLWLYQRNFLVIEFIEALKFYFKLVFFLVIILHIYYFISL